MFRYNRRLFLQRAGAAAIVAGPVIAGTKASGRVLGANDRVRIAVAGINGRGQAHITAYGEMRDVEIAWLVDPDSRLFALRSAAVRELSGNTPRCVRDFRRARRQDARRRLPRDAQPLARPAGRLGLPGGKGRAGRKAGSHNVVEGRRIVEAARKYDRIVQHGTQRRSDLKYIKLTSDIRQGRYGRLLIAYAYSYRPRQSTGFRNPEQPPAGLDYDLWIGPAPVHPYRTHLLHYEWHWNWDFGNGEIGNLGTHQMDVARWAMPAGAAPHSIASLGGRFGYQDQGQTPMQVIIDELGGLGEPLLPGYRTKIVDGNHLRRTDRRIGELRELNAAPLPGQSLVVYDPQYRLAIDAVPCEDGHAQERSLLWALLDMVQPKDLWIADRNFCTIDFLFGIALRRGKFIIRQHGNLPFRLKGRRRFVGQIETGLVYEQSMEVTDSEGITRVFRRITVKLKEPTRDGDTELHIVTNLPKRVDAMCIANLYRKRWSIETAFQEVAENLEGEIKTLGYPKAALFGFSMALVTYNLLSVVRAAVQAVHGEEAAERLSSYYMSHEVAATHLGISLILEGPFWQDKYGHLTPAEMAAELRYLAGHIRLSKYPKAKYKPRKKPKTTMNKTHRRHVSTARVLEKARSKAAKAT